MKNGILSIDLATLADAVLMAVIVAVVAMLVQLVSNGSFDVFSANWAAIGKSMVNLGFAAAVLTIGKDLLSTNTGSLLGITPGYSNPQG